MKIIVATGNLHKIEELNRILTGHELLLPSDAGIENWDCEETGSTYLANAMLKAESLYDSLQCPVLADDSGINVAALNGAPGIYSARYGSAEKGRNLESEERNLFLLENMKGAADREAWFTCCMVLILDKYRVFTAQETFHGMITETPGGTGGFGYDPLFFLEEYGKTVAELPGDLKNRISHRGRAGQRIQSILASL